MPDIQPQPDRLVSTAVLLTRLAELEAEVEAQRNVRADDDPFFRIAAWLIAEVREALRQAAREYRPTADVAALTGWTAQTLRAKGREILAGRDPGEGWEGTLVRFDAGEYSFALATVPLKRTGHLRQAS